MGNLDTPNDSIFKHFMISTGIVIDDLMNMTKNKQTIIKIDCKKVDTEKFRQLYTVILSYFSFLFNVTNRALKEDVKKALIEVTNRPKMVQRIFKNLVNVIQKAQAR